MVSNVHKDEESYSATTSNYILVRVIDSLTHIFGWTKGRKLVCPNTYTRKLIHNKLRSESQDPVICSKIMKTLLRT